MTEPETLSARFAARALHREYPEALTPYGEIWSGQAWQKDATRRPVSEAVDTVVKKVGGMLHLHRASAFESTKQMLARTSELWTRHERVVLVVDGIEAFSAAGGEDPRRQALANSGFESRVSQVAWELRQLSEHG